MEKIVKYYLEHKREYFMKEVVDFYIENKMMEADDYEIVKNEEKTLEMVKYYLEHNKEDFLEEFVDFYIENNKEKKVSKLRKIITLIVNVGTVYVTYKLIKKFF